MQELVEELRGLDDYACLDLRDMIMEQLTTHGCSAITLTFLRRVTRDARPESGSTRRDVAKWTGE